MLGRFLPDFLPFLRELTGDVDANFGLSLFWVADAWGVVVHFLLRSRARYRGPRWDRHQDVNRYGIPVVGVAGWWIF